MFKATIVADGEVVGTWARRAGAGGVVVEAMPFGGLSTSEAQAVRAAAQGYGRFLERPATIRAAGTRAGS